MRDPRGHGHGANIGVVLYQRAYYVTQGKQDKCRELLRKELYPAGGMNVPWESDPAEMYDWHGFFHHHCSGLDIRWITK